MTMRKTIMAAIVATSMVVVPTVAQAAAANQSSVSKLSVRSSQQLHGLKESKAGEGSNTIYYVAAAAAAIGLAFLVFEKKSK
jgi:ABC-type phosphate transport system substrate-binding protein